MALPPVMASGLLSPEDMIMTENPYSGLFAEPANNFTFLPIAKTESGRFRPAVPQFVQSMYDASLGDDGVGGLLNDIPQSILFRNIADQYMDEAGNFFINPKTGKPFSESQLTRSIFTKLPASQVDDQMLQEYDFYQSLLGK